MYERLATIKHNGDWFLGEILPLSGDLAGLGDQPANKLVAHMEPIQVDDTPLHYTVIWVVKLDGNDSDSILKGAQVYLQSIRDFNTTRKSFG